MVDGDERHNGVGRPNDKERQYHEQVELHKIKENCCYKSHKKNTSNVLIKEVFKMNLPMNITAFRTLRT